MGHPVCIVYLKYVPMLQDIIILFFVFFFRHDDANDTLKNPENECYCLENEGFKCLPSGVMYMEPCKRKDEALVALSMPHFYQADPVLLERVGGLKPEKEKHQFYMDVVPEFGFPLAIRPRFQLNVVISGKTSGFVIDIFLNNKKTK